MAGIPAVSVGVVKTVSEINAGTYGATCDAVQLHIYLITSVSCNVTRESGVDTKEADGSLGR